MLRSNCGWAIKRNFFPVTCVLRTRVSTLKLIEADESCRQTRDFHPRSRSRGSAFDGVYAAVKRHDRAGKSLLLAHGSQMRRSHHAVFALLLQDDRFVGAGCGCKSAIQPDPSGSLCVPSAPNNCFQRYGAPSRTSLICCWSFTA